MLRNIKDQTSIPISKKATLLIAASSSFLTPFTSSSVNIALPSIGTEFSMSAVLIGWVPTSFLLAAAVFLVPFGRAADIYGRKKVFTWGFLVFTISSLLLAISTSSILLISFRILQGIGSAMIFGTGMAILTSVFPANERGRALGINVAAVYLGLSLGPVLGGFLTQNFGWRSIFFINVPLGLMIVALIHWKLKGEWAGARGENFDLVGSIAYGLSLVVMMYGFSILPTKLSILLVLSGALGMIGFLRWERKTESPVFNMGLFRNNRVFVFSNLAALINYSATFAVSFLLSLYLQYIKGFSPQHAGLVLVFQPAIQVIVSPFAGRLSDKIEPRVVASIGMALTFTGLCLLSFLSANTTLQFIIISLIILGFGFALFSSPNTNAVMSSIEKKFYGVASATLGTMRLTGNMLGMGIIMILLTIFMGRVQITPQYYPFFLSSLKVAFMVFAALCFAGIFASFVRGRLR